MKTKRDCFIALTILAALFNSQLSIVQAQGTGVTWTAGGAYAPWRSVASSADGTKLVAVDYPGGGTNGFIYISGTLIKPALTVFAPFTTPFSNNVAVTWPYPSTGWTLQQNTGLTSAGWSPSAGVTNNGHVNYLVTPPMGKMFFRLQLQQ